MENEFVTSPPLQISSTAVVSPKLLRPLAGAERTDSGELARFELSTSSRGGGDPSEETEIGRGGITAGPGGDGVVLMRSTTSAIVARSLSRLLIPG